MLVYIWQQLRFIINLLTMIRCYWWPSKIRGGLRCHHIIVILTKYILDQLLLLLHSILKLLCCFKAPFLLTISIIERLRRIYKVELLMLFLHLLVSTQIIIVYLEFSQFLHVFKIDVVLLVLACGFNVIRCFLLCCHLLHKVCMVLLVQIRHLLQLAINLKIYYNFIKYYFYYNMSSPIYV